jgi:hypothetical protein
MTQQTLKPPHDVGASVVNPVGDEVRSNLSVMGNNEAHIDRFLSLEVRDKSHKTVESQAAHFLEV